MTKITDFIDLNLNQKKMVLEWRNHPLIQNVMYNKTQIKLEEHLNFIHSLKNNNTKKYFLIEEDNQSIGVIDFVNINANDAELGIYTNPNLKGQGKTLLKILCTYAFNALHLKKIYAEVYINNIKAIKLYEEFHFKTIGKKIKDTSEIYCMELTYENW